MICNKQTSRTYVYKSVVQQIFFFQILSAGMNVLTFTSMCFCFFCGRFPAVKLLQFSRLFIPLMIPMLYWLEIVIWLKFFYGKLFILSVMIQKRKRCDIQNYCSKHDLKFLHVVVNMGKTNIHAKSVPILTIFERFTEL